jgi:hypothetical protein
LDGKVATPGLEKARLTAVQIRCADHATPLYRQTLALTSPIGGRSVGAVRLRTNATEFSSLVLVLVTHTSDYKNKLTERGGKLNFFLSTLRP